MKLRKLSKYAGTLMLCLILTACSSYSVRQGTDDFFDGAITNATENQKKADANVGNVESSTNATADVVVGALNVGFNWLWSLFQPEKN